MSFGLQYWFLFLLAIIIATTGTVFLLYYKNKTNKELSNWQVRTLAGLRFLSFFAIALLLLSPFIRNLRKISNDPIIICAWDNSSSMTGGVDSLEVRQQLTDTKNTMVTELNKRFTVLEYTFGEQAKVEKELNNTEKESDYSELLQTVSNNHFNENIGAILLAGDGIYNVGSNPLNVINDINIPVYTIGFGDTSQVVDSRIQNINVNRTSFSGNRFPVEIDLSFLKLKGKPHRLSIHQNGELESRIISPGSDNYFTTQEFIIESGNAGLKHFDVKLEPVEKEINTNNNEAKFVVNVLENKQKILIVSDGPHPDIGVIKNTLDQQMSYDVSVFTREPYPADLSIFNLLIVNQLPSRRKSVSQLLDLAEKNRLPVLFILGNNTYVPQLNQFDAGVEINSRAGSGENARPMINSSYATFKLSEELINLLPQLPPLQVHFADYELNPGIQPLAYQRILNIETGKPLIATGKYKGRKTGFIFGEGIWRWRLYNYYNSQNHNAFNELINQMVQYLALRENEDNFIVDFKPVYSETEDVIFKAEVYNDAFERITTEEVSITIQHKDGDELNLVFDNQGDDYFLNAGKLPTGDFTFSANVTIGNETFNESGSFTNTEVSMESIYTRANHNLLYQLANQSGGKFYVPDQVDQLVNDLKSSNQIKTTNYFQESIHKLLNLKWLFLVILLLLSMEWFLRKFWGIY